MDKTKKAETLTHYIKDKIQNNEVKEVNTIKETSSVSNIKPKELMIKAHNYKVEEFSGGYGKIK